LFKSVRLRLTVWYITVFGALLVVFSIYLYSLLTSDLQQELDRALLRTASATASYFNEFVERKNELAGAKETVLEVQFEDLHSAIYREGELLATSRPDIAGIVRATRILVEGVTADQPVFATDTRTGTRLVAVGFREDQNRYHVVVLQPLRELTEQLVRLRRIFLFGIPAALLMAAAGGFFLAHKSLERVVQITNQTQRIGAENLHERLHISNPNDEFGRLASAINALLARLETSFRVMREFVADASHELRTPVAIVHAEADVTLAKERSTEEYREALQVIHKLSARLRGIVNDMLVLARADAGRERLNLKEVYLDDLVDECCHAAQTLAAPAGVSLQVESDSDISFTCDEELLRRMTLNLLDNAIHYTPAGGSVRVSLKQMDSAVCLAVADTGIGIAKEAQARIFDRFFRADDSRSPNGHSGLGLSIVKLAAEAHRGRVDLESEPGKGSTFTVHLPLS
jgi:heavy metal sensor kinase